MTKNLPAVRAEPLPLLPVAVAALGADGKAAFMEFFTAQISNNNTRQAYLHAVRRFCTWLDERSLRLEGLQPVHVEAYIEPMDKARDQGGHGLAPAMVKRRCKAAGLGDRFSSHAFRAIGITAYLSNDGQLDKAQQMAAHVSS